MPLQATSGGMKVFKKLLKILGSLVLLGLIIFGIVYLIYNEALPHGKSGLKADALAQKMLKIINNDAYTNTRYLEWSYVDGAHQYKWDKENGKVEVKWDDYTVNLNLNDTSKSLVFKKDEQLSTKKSQELITTARNYFNNDSFWLVAPFKVFDKGTKRSIVKQEDGSDGLLVTYAAGGTTPGDSYLWKLNANGFPESYKMWVKIIPVGGIEASWDDWQVMESNVFLPTSHKIGPFTLNMGKVKAYN